jgi:hypothetical protein
MSLKDMLNKQQLIDYIQTVEFASPFCPKTHIKLNEDGARAMVNEITRYSKCYIKIRKEIVYSATIWESKYTYYIRMSYNNVLSDFEVENEYLDVIN